MFTDGIDRGICGMRHVWKWEVCGMSLRGLESWTGRTGFLPQNLSLASLV
jgi:hypothetical protein